MPDMMCSLFAYDLAVQYCFCGKTFICAALSLIFCDIAEYYATSNHMFMSDVVSRYALMSDRVSSSLWRGLWS